MAALLALAAAFGWGSSDFASGIASRKNTAISVVVLTHLTAVVALAIFSSQLADLSGAGLTPVWEHVGLSGRVSGYQIRLPSLGFGGVPGLADIAWGAAAGLGGGLGAMLLYRGLGRGTMAVVAPTTAAGAAAIPAVFGLATGDPVTVLSIVGIAGALVSIFLISTSGDAPSVPEPSTVESPSARAEVSPGPASSRRMVSGRRRRRSAMVPFTVSCFAAAMTLLFGNDLSPAATRVLGLCLCIIAIATTLMLGVPEPPEPDEPAGPAAGRRSTMTEAALFRLRHALKIPGLPEALLSGLGFGSFFILLARTGEDAGLWPLVSARGISVVLFAAAALATRGNPFPHRGSRWSVVLSGLLDAFAATMFLAATRAGHLSVVTVLSSMYPVITVGLARTLSHERCSRLQVVGLGLAGCSVGVLALS